MKEVVDQLQNFKFLKILNLEQNRISDYNMQLFQNTLPSTVEFFNNVQVKGKKDKNAEIKDAKKEQNIEFNDDDFYAHADDAGKQGQQFEQQIVLSAASKEKLTLESFTRRLEEANKNPTRALKHIHVITLCAEAIQTIDPMKLEAIFTEGNLQDDIDELIESFMQNAILMVENFDNLRNNIFSVLAKMSMIQSH